MRTGTGRWNRTARSNAVVLAGNAVVAAHAGEVEVREGQWAGDPAERIRLNRSGLLLYKSWKLSTFARADGAELWSVALPTEPLLNGLAIADDGAVLVTMRDGSVACVH